jgi:hypothetical protein
VLSVACGLTRSTYIDAPAEPVERLIDRYVRVRYRYVDREATDIRCPQPPCSPVSERRVAIERIEPLSLTEREAAEISRACAATPQP